MNQTALWLGAGVALGLLAGLVAGRHWQQQKTEAIEKKLMEQADAAQQRLTDLTGRFERQTAQVNTLQRDNELRQQRAHELETALTAAKDEAETLRRARPKADSEDALPAPAAETLNAPLIRVLEFNPQAQMVMVDVGAQGGMQLGMSFFVVHGKTPVAEVRAADVRETFSGMVIEKMYAGKQPAPGDRLVVRKK